MPASTAGSSRSSTSVPDRVDDGAQQRQVEVLPEDGGGDEGLRADLRQPGDALADDATDSGGHDPADVAGVWEPTTAGEQPQDLRDEERVAARAPANGVEQLAAGLGAGDGEQLDEPVFVEALEGDRPEGRLARQLGQRAGERRG